MTLTFLCSLTLLLPLAHGKAADDERAEARERPNVLLFLTDDQSWLHAGCYGNESLSTPNLDQLARDGLLFTHAFAASPSCTASRSAILTGQEIWRLEEGGVFGATLPRKFPVFPLQLQKSGYRIGWTGKGWGPGNLKTGGWRNTYPLGRPYNEVRFDADELELRTSLIDYVANFETFLKESDASQPFFFWCGVLEPHLPYASGSWRSAGKTLDQAQLSPHETDSEESRGQVLDYYVEIEYLDRVLGDLVDVLKKQGHYDRTLILITSDNGVAGPRAKGTLYDLGIRVPLITHWPRSSGGKVIDDLVTLTDIPTTVLDACGVEIPESMTGRSFLGLFDEQRAEDYRPRSFVAAGIEDTPIYSFGPARVLRTHDYAYLRNFASRTDRNTRLGDRPAEELYDTQEDPFQLVNLAEDADHKETLESMRSLLEQYQSDTRDPRVTGGNPWQGYTEVRRTGWQLSTFGTQERVQ